MFIALRICTVILKLIMVIVILLLGYLFFEFKYKGVPEVSYGPVTIAQIDNTYKLVIDKQERGLLKTVADKLNMVIYQKAEEYNPTGDLVPDDLDNTIKDKIKESIL